MVSQSASEIRIIDPMLFLECIGSKAPLAKLLASEEVHMLVIFGCKEEHRFEYVDVGPTRRIRSLDAALSARTEGHAPRFVVPSRNCPKESFPLGYPNAHSIPYALAKVIPMAPAIVSPNRAPASDVTAETVVDVAAQPAAVQPSVVESVPATPSSEIKSPAVKAAGATPPVPETKSVAPAKPFVRATPVKPLPSFDPLPDENLTDTLRRAMHSVLSSITDREASLNVREATVEEIDEKISLRNAELQRLDAGFAAREAAVVALEKSLAERETMLAKKEKEFAVLDEDFKTRKNSVAFREKSLAAREQETESRIFDINAREGALVPNEQALKTREAELVRREKDCKALVDSLAAEKARMDEEMHTFYRTLASREEAVAAREKVVAAQESTFKAEASAMLRTLESLTTASRASVVNR